jgi:hypothetical protein
VRHHPRTRGTSIYGLSRIAKVLADLLTIKMIRSFRERPLAMCGIGAIFSVMLAMAFGAASVIAYSTFQPTKAQAFVFPGAALLWLGLSCYLVMLGIVGEVALSELRRTGMEQLPVVRESYR